jgi:hypothetical protein
MQNTSASTRAQHPESVAQAARAADEIIERAQHLGNETQALRSRIEALASRLRVAPPQLLRKDDSDLAPAGSQGFISDMRGNLTVIDENIDVAHKLMAEIESLI